MDFPKDFTENNVFETDDSFIFYFLCLGIITIFGYVLFYFFNSENLFEEIERKLIEMKENIAFYTNQILLKSNMEGDAIKTTQVSSFL